MRMFDNDREMAISDVLILLKRSEAEEMRDILDELLESSRFIHEHILDADDINRQITMALYDDTNIERNPYMPRIIELIENGE